MSKIFEDTLSGLLEAMEIQKGQVPLESQQDMPAPTFQAVDQELACCIRKRECGFWKLILWSRTAESECDSS